MAGDKQNKSFQHTARSPLLQSGSEMNLSCEYYETRRVMLTLTNDQKKSYWSWIHTGLKVFFKQSWHKIWESVYDVWQDWCHLLYFLVQYECLKLASFHQCSSLLCSSCVIFYFEPWCLANISRHHLALNQLQRWNGIHLTGILVDTHNNSPGKILTYQSMTEESSFPQDSYSHPPGLFLYKFWSFFQASLHLQEMPSVALMQEKLAYSNIIVKKGKWYN